MTYATIQEINTAIIAGNFSNDQLISIGDAIRYARAELAKQNTRTLRIGATVKFTSSRTGQSITGTVDSVKIKNVIVATAQGRYRVPASMLEVV
jgi:hypothetical protein